MSAWPTGQREDTPDAYYQGPDGWWEEEVRCAALGLEGPNAKLYRAAVWGELADRVRDDVDRGDAA